VSGEKKTLFTGGSGLLGTAFQKRCPQFVYPDETEFDITNYRQMDDYVRAGEYDAIFHAAAFTSPPKIDADPLLALDVNIIGTANVVKLAMAHSLKLVYVSTDYVFRGDRGNYAEEDEVLPVNKYAWSKLGGECAVRLYNNSLIIRTTFGAVPFPYEKAFVDQWTSRESVTVIVDMIAALLDTDAQGVVHVGGKRKTVFAYAKSLDQNRDIVPLHAGDVAFQVPRDTSLDCSRYGKLVKIY
jgi:dTDP-4-dehydrorhamnose reductase